MGGPTSLREKSMVASQTYSFDWEHAKTSICLQGPTEAQAAKYMKSDNVLGYKEGPLTHTSCASKGFAGNGYQEVALMANIARCDSGGVCTDAVKYPHEV